MADSNENMMIDEFHLMHVSVVLLVQTFQLFFHPQFLLLQVALLQLELSNTKAVLVQLY